METVPGDGRVGTEEPGGEEDLLEGTHGFDTLGGEALACAGKEAEAALIPAEQVHRAELLAAFGDQIRTVLCEVFLNAAAAWGSLATCDLRAVFTCAPHLRFTNPFKVL